MCIYIYICIQKYYFEVSNLERFGRCSEEDVSEFLENNILQQLCVL